MAAKTPEEIIDDAQAWWSTSIIDIHPGKIAMRGYAIEELIGTVRFPQMIWLMLRGELPTPAQAELLEHSMVAAVDHGPHAPSIAISRMAVSCGLPVNGAMASAINALDDVHGGAGQQCMELYCEIAAEAGAHVEDEADVTRATEVVIGRWRERGIKIFPGFGHRFHPLDPRSPRLLALVDAAQAKGVVGGRFARIGRAVEAVLGRGRPKPIPMNIDGVTAIIYCELGFEPELGRGIFILSRAVGILAHAWEQKQQGARIKGPMPKTIPYRYTGAAPRPVPAQD
ncbi:Citrate synthase (si) [Rubrivivax sp. A210]|uniref:citryl-CoA lyase n=1 Tax=Rubrivivax sp. A210 TaxID=2772301 RepID=UPI00191B18D6|nr:citryl-CoA lyase [Rubrivivax sp. A210]CAD5375123.1 Citrate synthase (si) [Rubrivivax sp. A210]